MKLSVITLTGARPEAFKLCQEYYKRQTLHKNQSHSIEWIIIDDGLVKAVLDKDASFKGVYPWPAWTPDTPDTFRRNLKVALKEVTGDIVAFMEDDDWYDETYLEWIINNFQQRLSQFPMALGESHAKYYNLKWRKSNERTYPDYAALAQTSLDAALIPHLQQTLSDYKDNIDLYFWKTLPKTVIRNLQPNLYNRVIGIKGMPGREGIGRGHKKVEQHQWFKDDENFTDLINYVGMEDAKAYIDIMKKYKEQGIK